MKKITLTFKGQDSWSRPVYETEDGRLYVDVDPRKGLTAKLCTKYGNAFDGEPDMPISDDIEPIFVPHRVLWD